ncbi:hypothetical protein [Chryseobacterium takakiae]|uniref:Uncharacterized protein n=1 Tax=Chryseobacterium takakiae TaxID=1302685 RepID=A0A1M4VAH5_9FLAO|nr:hypothetical protein [Chryseobacterium takakiae]SHE65974.1 hypothetical protein SAMN05444408_10312 [Chryseobacterium takakiae]
MKEETNENLDEETERLLKEIEQSRIELEETFLDIDKTMASLEKKSYDGVRDIFKYFDRINDKLFNFNNILIAGFFAISKLKDDVPMWMIIFPIVNLGVFIFIEYMIMEKSRMEAYILENFNEERYRKNINKTNLYVLIAITTTSVVTLVFLYNLLK